VSRHATVDKFTSHPLTDVIYVHRKNTFVLYPSLLELKDLIAKMPAELVKRRVEKVVIVEMAGFRRDVYCNILVMVSKRLIVKGRG